jgi:GntR family transcriptional regulator
MYQQIADDLRRKIESGHLAPGQQLPTELVLREEYSASRNTVRDAIKRLSSLGLVESRPGSGTFVTRKIDPFVTTLYDPDRDPEAGMAGGEGVAAFDEIRERLAYADSPEEPHASVPRVEMRAAPSWVADQLRISPDDVVIVRHQEFYVGSTPWSLQTTFYPMSLVERGATDLLRARDIKEGTVRYLAGKGLAQCGSRLRILVRPPNDGEIRFFGLPGDGRTSMISLIRTGYEDRPQEGPYPFRVTFTVLPADRNQFVINAGMVPEELAAPALDQ